MAETHRRADAWASTCSAEPMTFRSAHASRKAGDRFAGLGAVSTTGAVFIKGHQRVARKRDQQLVPAGDHTSVVLRVNQVQVDPNVAPVCSIAACSAPTGAS